MHEADLPCIPLRELVAQLGGEVAGNAEVMLSGIAPLETAGATELSFLSNPRLRTQAAQTHAAVLITRRTEQEWLSECFGGTLLFVDNPYVYFARAAQLFEQKTAAPVVSGVHSTAVIDPAATIAASARIGPYVTIEADAVVAEDCVIDAGCHIGQGASVGQSTHFFSHVSFQAYCEIGARGIVHSGAVIGADGFGFANDQGRWVKIPQTGRVVIGDDVEIGANTTIDRGAMADTVIEDGVKLDNQIQIAHNCHIGAHTAMAGCVGVAGSAHIGRHCTFGGAAMILGHLTIADHVHISSGSLVSRSISEPGQYTGIYPLAKNADWEKSAVLVRNLGTMREKIRALEKAVKLLTTKES